MLRLASATFALRMHCAIASAPAATAAGASCSAAEGLLPFTLLEKTQQSPDSWLLRFKLPPGKRWLGEDTTLPTCIKVLHPNGTNAKDPSAPLEKSYSPVSHPQTEDTVDLVVKAYEPRPGGGVGDYICRLAVGDVMHGALKGKRKMHGDPTVLHRWSDIGLVAGGTGIAPLLQIARLVLDEPTDRTRVKLLAINRHEEDILMRAELDQLAQAHPERFAVSYALTAPPSSGWHGYTGRGDAEMIRATLPPPTHDGQTMVLVCGKDGFVETWGGPVGRGPKKPDGSKGGKVQGPLLGLLAEAGYKAEEVFKY